MSTVRWYSQLNRNEKGTGLLNVEIPTARNLIVCQEAKYRNFALFNDYLEYAWYFRFQVVAALQCFYELIFAHQAQKPYFDLDIPLTPESGVPLEEALQLPGVPELPASCSTTVKPKLTLSVTRARLAVQCLVTKIKQVCPQILDTDIHITESCSKIKASYHVVVDNWCCVDAQHNRAFYDRIMSLYPKEWRWIVDNSMYKSIQQFRIYKCHKWNSSRVKNVSDLSKWQPSTPTESPDHEFIQILGATLVTNASYCKLLPEFQIRVASPLRTKSRHEAAPLLASEASGALKLCASSGSAPFKIQRVEGRLVLLSRLAPSTCPTCKRVHEHENPFLVVTGRNREVYFDCRRAAGARSLIGTLGPLPSPQSLTPEKLTPQSLTPEKLTPQSLTPEKLTPQSLMPPQPLTPQRLSPHEGLELMEHITNETCNVPELKPESPIRIPYIKPVTFTNDLPPGTAIKVGSQPCNGKRFPFEDCDSKLESKQAPVPKARPNGSGVRVIMSKEYQLPEKTVVRDQFMAPNRKTALGFNL